MIKKLLVSLLIAASFCFGADVNSDINTGTSNDLLVTTAAAPSFADLNSGLFGAATGYVNIGNASSLNFAKTNAFSVSLWMKTPSGAGTNGFIALLSKRNPSAPNEGWVCTQNNSSVPYFIFKDTAGGNIQVAGSTNVLNNTYHNITWTYDGSGTAAGVKIYVNGVLETLTVSSDTLSGTTTNTANVLLGRDPVATQNFEGNIDDVAVYNVALSAAQVTAIYNSGKPTDLTALSSFSSGISWWTFESVYASDTYNGLIHDKFGTNNGTPTGTTSSFISTTVP